MPHHLFENCQRIQFDSWIDFTLNGILRAPQINSAPCDFALVDPRGLPPGCFLLGSTSIRKNPVISMSVVFTGDSFS
jgi:hypothetical protein